MGGPILGFCGGRIDDIDGSESNLLGPTPEQEMLYPCETNGKCEKPLGTTTIGLIYLNPEGPMAQPNPQESVTQIRDTFGRMNMNDSETIALIGGGHAVGKTHGACKTGAGPSPKEDPEHPWPGTCGEGDGKGKGKNAFTSGFEFPWTTTPTKWSNQYFHNLLNYSWVLDPKENTPGGHNEWKVDGVSPKAPEAHGNGTQNIGMLTTDRSLLEDEQYLALLKSFENDEDAFNYAFKHAWYKLTTRDMGPSVRCLGDSVPPPQDWQYPLPDFNGVLPDFDVVKKDIKALFTIENKGMFARLAWQCMSTFRSTDYLGGCNGARIRFEPQSSWDVNNGTKTIIEMLKPVKDTHGESLSWADLITLAGNTEIENMGGNAMVFCGERTDAQEDGKASEYLEPRITGQASETNLLFKEFIGLMGLTTLEYAALHGAGYAIGQPTDCVGLYCRRDTKPIDKVSNVFFKNLIENEWERNNEEDQCYRTNTDSDLCMYSADVQFYFDAKLKVIAEEYASNNDLFLKNLASAWTKFANADRFDGPTGNVCDNNEVTTTPMYNHGINLTPVGSIFVFFTIMLINLY